MASVAPSQGAASSSRRKSVSLNPTPVPPPFPRRQSNSAIPDDEDYDYSDAGPSISPTNPKLVKQRLGDTGTVIASDDPERFADELRTILFEKAISCGRAKLADGAPAVSNGIAAAPNGQPAASPAKNALSKRKKRHIFNVTRPPTTGKAPRSAEETVLRKVELHWSREQIEGVEKYSLNTCNLHNDVSTGLENSVLWQ